MRGRSLQGFLLLTFLIVPFAAESRETAPRFSARTLGGETITNDSQRGQITLLQFWTTWCPICKSDQAGLDQVASEFGRKGLVVVAVDVNESGEHVKKFLADHPRSGNVVLTENTNLVAAFTPKSFPYYVLIDRDGTIAGTQSGGGGERALRDLLSDAGLGRSSADSDDSDRRAYARHLLSSSPRLIDAPRGKISRAPKPQLPAVFILNSGERFEARNYTIMLGTLHITSQGSERKIPLTDVNLKATLAANHARGIDLRIPVHQNEISLGF